MPANDVLVAIAAGTGFEPAFAELFTTGREVGAMLRLSLFPSLSVWWAIQVPLPIGLPSVMVGGVGFEPTLLSASLVTMSLSLSLGESYRSENR